MRAFIQPLLPTADLFLSPLIYPTAWLMKKVRQTGLHRLPRCRDALLKIGVLPIQNHYYEPQFDFSTQQSDFTKDRKLPGIDWNVAEQLALLQRFQYADELKNLPNKKGKHIEFHFNNQNFESGDAEYWYQLVRTVRPTRIIEIGSGNSTLMAIKAIRANQQATPDYQCEHICIEPYEMPWLEQSGVTVVRKKVEDMDVAFFAQLQANDILFIDSSHIIRPHGDVLFEYLELLPTLNPGVIVHIHDIFSPRNYLPEWVRDEVRLWNEQYLLEAFLSNNKDWKIIGALNFLQHHHHEQLKAVAPYLTPERNPGSFYIQKVA